MPGAGGRPESSGEPCGAGQALAGVQGSDGPSSPGTAPKGRSAEHGSHPAARRAPGPAQCGGRYAGGRAVEEIIVFVPQFNGSLLQSTQRLI